MGGEPALLKGVCALGLFLLLTLYTASGQAISIFGVSASYSLCKVLRHGLRSCRGQELLPVVSSQAAMGSHWCLLQPQGSTGAEQEWVRRKMVSETIKPDKFPSALCVLWLVERTLMWTGCIFSFRGCPWHPGLVPLDSSRSWNMPLLWHATWQCLQWQARAFHIKSARLSSLGL